MVFLGASFLVGTIWFFLGIVSLLLIGVVLIQDSKAGGLSSAFGGGGGDALLGASGQKEITKFTVILAVLFFALSLFGGILAKSGSSVIQEDELETEITGEGGAAPADTTGAAGTSGSATDATSGATGNGSTNNGSTNNAGTTNNTGTTNNAGTTDNNTGTTNNNAETNTNTGNAASGDAPTPPPTPAPTTQGGQ